MTMKRGRGSFKKEIDSSSDSRSSSSSSSSSSNGSGMGLGSGGAGMGSSFARGSGTKASSSTTTNRNWVLIPNSSIKDLPTQDGQVQLLDTKYKPLVDDGTNPTGAVSTLRYGEDIYCFSSSCPTCKIPLTKAKALPPNDETGNKSPRLSCDFCKATFNLKTGQKVKSVSGSGILGNIAKTVLSANESGPLPVYQLGDKNGQLVISID
jgi:nitrite reductase/ring-hydroxylating ferredoxin subunit